jgi:hypothetical protein
LNYFHLKDKLGGEDISESLLECLKTKNIDINRIVSISTDGAPSMIAKNKGFLKLFSMNISHDIIPFHCILHQEALIAKSLGAIPELKGIMDVVIQIVNFIKAKALNHRQFSSLLQEMDNKYTDLCTFTAVRWLSGGLVLKRFSECLEEIIIFLNTKYYNREHITCLTNPLWLQNFYFLLDMTEHFNRLNVKLQGKGNTALQLLEEVLIFEQKLELFSEDISKDEFLYFENMRNFRSKLNCEIEITNYKVFSDMIINILKSYKERFQDFRNYQEMLKFLLYPLECNLKLFNLNVFPEVQITELQLELLEIKNKNIWSSKLQEMIIQIETNLKSAENIPQQIIFNFWNSLPTDYGHSRKLAFDLLTLFGSTYSCEQFFSTMRYIKNKYRSRLTDESLKALVKVKNTKYMPNLRKLAENFQILKPH